MHKDPRKNMVWIGVLLTATALVFALAYAYIYLDRHCFFSSALQQQRCLGRLREIVRAKQEFQKEWGVTNGTAVTGNQLVEFVNGGWLTLRCPARGEYRINALGSDPVCAIHGAAPAKK